MDTASTFGGCSDQELLQVLLGKDLATSLNGVSLAQIFGLHNHGKGVACESLERYMASPVLQAAKELVTRAINEDMKFALRFQSARDVGNYLKLKIGALSHEVFWVMFLDSQNRLIRHVEMFRGSIRQASVYPREIVKEALEANASSVILAHNHPSGSVEPSSADIELTKVVKKTLELVDVEVLDHIVVSATAMNSLAERGLI